MNKIFVILLLLVASSSVKAQIISSSSFSDVQPNLSLDFSRELSKEVYFPEDYMPPLPLSRTSFQKGIGISTDVLTITLPAAAIIGTAINGDWEGMTQIGFTALVAGGANVLLKYSVRELRPDQSNYHSFPSLHSTVAFASAAYLQRRYGWKFGGPAYAIATYVAVGRVLAKKHHWWDCVAGAAIGVGGAYLFTTPWAKKHEFAVAPVASEEYVGVTASLNF